MRKRTAKELIRFAISQNSLGSIFAASSEKGVCAILLGDNAKALIAELHSRFLEVELHVGDAGFEAWVAKVVRAVETPDSTLDIPLDLAAPWLDAGDDEGSRRC